MPRAPAFLRIVRALRWAGIAVVVAILIYASLAIVSASRLHPSSQGSGHSSLSLESDGSLVLSTGINLSNPGFLPMNSIVLSAVVDHAGSFLARGSSPSVAIGAGATASIPLTLRISSATFTAAADLFTQDQPLPTTVWANATYASLFDVGVRSTQNISWGAPFYGLNVTVGSPNVSGGASSVPVSLSFSNHASFGINGTLTFAVHSSTAAGCAGQAIPLQVGPSQSFAKTVTVTLAPGCNPSGGTVDSVFSTGLWTVTLPKETIP